MRSALEGSWLDCEHVNTVVVQGTTVVLARRAPGVARGATRSEAIESSFCFSALSASADGSGAVPEFRRLPFPNQLLPVGMEIVKVLTHYGVNQYWIPVTDAGGRFRAVAFGESIYIFRRSTDGTLLSTRFRLIREGSTATPDRVSYSLESPWEVRFQASQEPGAPAGGQGAQTFHEPTFELSMVRGISTDSFDIEIVPVAGGRAMCHVFLVLPDESKIRVFSLPIDECGQYDLQGL